MSKQTPKENAHVIPTSISRTALDSLQAKLSAIDGGWLDGGGGRDVVHRCTVSSDGDKVDGDGNSSSRGCTATSSSSSSSGPIDSYCKLLQRIHSGILIEGQQKTKCKRQTPLVNAGYAARMSVMTFILEQWLHHVIIHRGAETTYNKVNNKESSTIGRTRSESQCINVVLIGGGMDALGVWSKQLLLNECSSPKSSALATSSGNDEATTCTCENTTHAMMIIPKLKVYEFDAWDNCILKQQALVNSGVLQESYSYSNNNEARNNNGEKSSSEGSASCSCSCIISKGKIKLNGILEESDNDQKMDADDYYLTALDLRETQTSSLGSSEQERSILSEAIQTLGLDASQPTIVLSELVLAYLGYGGANATMQTIATEVLIGNKYSMFACLEPVFPSETTSSGKNIMTDPKSTRRILSVEESYARDYSRQFLGKLQRGNSKNTSSKTRSSNSTAADTSSSWLHPLGSNAQNIQKRLEDCGFFAPPSSGISYASLGKAASTVAFLRRKSGAASFLRAKEQFDEYAALALNMNCYGVVCAFSSLCASKGEEEAHDWYRTICPWTPKTAVQIHSIATSLEDNQVVALYGQIYTHLYDEYPAIRKMVKSALKGDLRNTTGNNCTAVRNRFQEKGGDFWVAIDVSSSSRVVGCVGVQKRTKNGQLDENCSGVVEYEIQRLAVDDQCRGKGIGKKLLSAAEHHARVEGTATERNTTEPQTIKLWATTPECLDAANKLYESFDYAKEDTFMAGSLCMNVYCKTLTS